MFREDEAPSLFALKHSIYVGFPLCHVPASQLLQVPWAAWTPPLNSCYHVNKYDCNFAGELTSRSSSQKKDLKIEHFFWVILFGLKTICVGVLCSPRLSFAGGPACVGGLSSRRNQWGIAALCEYLSSWVLGCLYLFFCLVVCFPKKTDIFQWGKHTFVFYHPECFPFKIKTEAKWNIFWQEGGKRSIGWLFACDFWFNSQNMSFWDSP